MVLKNSNSHLNTGVTQRLTNRGAFSKHINSRTAGNPGTVSVFLTGHEDDSKESRAIFQDGMKTIYDYLDLRGPDLSLFYDIDGFTKPQFAFNEVSYTKSHSHANVSLSEKVKKMIDAKVLEPLIQAVEVEINVFKRCPHKPDSRNNSVFSWKSTEKKDKPSNTKEDRKLRRKKNNPNTHHRGIQRRNRVSVEGEHFSDEENSIRVPERKITIKIEEPYAVDARLVNKSNLCTKKIYPDRRGPLCKLKSFVNGLQSDFKGYTFSSLKEDETQALLEAAEEDDNFLYEDFRYTTDEEEDEDFDEYSSSQNDICLADYLITGRKVNKRHAVDIRESRLTLINSASSEKVVRHPKGSCVFMKETTEETDSDADTDSGFEGSSSVKSESTDEQDEETQTVERIVDSENFEFELMASIDDFISKFIKVQLTLSSDFLDKLLTFPTAESTYLEDGCCISFGNCYPPTFLLKTNSHQGKCDKTSLYLIGKATEMDDNHSWKWLVQVGKMNSCEPEKEFVDRIMSTLQETIVSEITLKDLIHISKDYFDLNLTSACQPLTTSTQSSVFSPPQPKESPWSELTHLIPMSAKTISLVEALGVIDSMNDRQIPQFRSVFQSDDKSSSFSSSSFSSSFSSPSSSFSSSSFSSSSSIVCDICFLQCDFSQNGDSKALALHPCGHVFCLTCWSSHVYLSLCNPDTIHCMHSDCKQELNETVLRSLAPGHMVNKWLQRLEDKTIERNPFSKWCPNTHCDMVAVLPQLSAKASQFGNLVLCDCQRHWCFSCQTEPHWPASCEQTAAFRKLLGKTGNNLEIPAARVDYTIQLKRCPKCHYPIEKNEGCPSMICRMCWFNFCWNCLRAVDHSVYSCKPRDNNFVTFSLQNKLVHDLPLKFFPDYLEMNRKRKNLENRRISSWIQNLQLYNSKLIKMPLAFSLRMRSNEEAKSMVVNLAETTVQFLVQVYAFLESCYTLLSFVNMIKDTPRNNINLILREFLHPAQTLRFITCRLEDQVVSKRLSQIMKYAPTAVVLIGCGKKQMKTMAKDLHILQNLTKDVNASTVGDIDPMKYFRYK